MPITLVLWLCSRKRPKGVASQQNLDHDEIDGDSKIDGDDLMIQSESIPLDLSDGEQSTGIELAKQHARNLCAAHFETFVKERRGQDAIVADDTAVSCLHLLDHLKSNPLPMQWSQLAGSNLWLCPMCQTITDSQECIRCTQGFQYFCGEDFGQSMGDSDQTQSVSFGAAEWSQLPDVLGTSKILEVSLTGGHRRIERSITQQEFLETVEVEIEMRLQDLAFNLLQQCKLDAMMHKTNRQSESFADFTDIFKPDFSYESDDEASFKTCQRIVTPPAHIALRSRFAEELLSPTEQLSIEHRIAIKLRQPLGQTRRIADGVSASTLSVLHFLEDLAFVLQPMCLSTPECWKEFQGKKFSKVVCSH